MNIDRNVTATELPVADEDVPPKLADEVPVTPAPEKQSFWSKFGKSKKVPEKPKEEPEPSVPALKLWRFATKLELVMVFIACLFALGMGILMPMSFIVLGDFVNNAGAGMAGLLPSTENLTPAEIEAYQKLIGTCPDGVTPKINIDFSTILPTILWFLYLGIMMIVFGYISQLFFILTGENQGHRIRKLYVHSVLRQDPGWFDKAEDGSLTTRLAQDTYLIQEGVSEKVGKVIQSIAGFLGGYILAFVKSWKMSLVLLSGVPIFSIGFLILISGTTKYTTQSQNMYAEAGMVAEQVISGIRTVQAFNMQSKFLKKYVDKLKNSQRSDFMIGVSAAIGLGIFLTSMLSMYGLAFYYGSRLVIWGEVKAGDVLVVFFGIMIGTMSMISAPPGITAISKAQAAAYKVFAVIDRVPPIDPDSETGISKKDGKFHGEIEFENVEFAYPSRPEVTVLQNFSLKIKPGMTVAFVGPSGSGKSTVVGLVQRFYDTISGTVKIDGCDVKDYNVRWLRENIGVVSQEPVLFNTTIKQNILLGTTGDITEAQLIETCKKANCHAFISKLPDGYDTYVESSQLSGGQKQRIAIARALVRDPRILLLDEASSALDTHSERIVQKALDAAAEDRTTLIVAHRLSTIKNADLIVVISKGEIVETGTHDELLKLGGTYSNLVEKQKIKSEELSSGSGEETKESESETEVGEAEKLDNKDEDLDDVQQPMIATVARNPNETILQIDDKDQLRERLRMASQQKKDEDNSLAKQKTPLLKVMKIMKVENVSVILGIIGAILGGIVFPIFGIILGKILALLNQPVSLIDPGPFQGVNFYAFVCFILGLVIGVGIVLQILFFSKAAAFVTKEVRTLTFASILRQEIAFFDEPGNGVGSLTSQLATDASKVGDMISNIYGDLVQLFATAVAGFVISFYYSWQLTLLLLAFVPFLLVGEYFESQQEMGLQNSIKNEYDHAAEVAAEAIKEFRTVASLNRQKYFEDRYAVKIEKPHKTAYRTGFLTSFGNGFSMAFQQLMNAGGFFAAIKFADACIGDLGNSFISILVITITAQGLGRSATFASGVAKAKIAAVKFFMLIERESKINPDEDGDHKYTPIHMDGDISAENIKFAYPSRPTEQIFSGDLNLKADKNTVVAFVGPSGCGKSTIIGLLERWYDVDDGVVSVDGKNVKEYQLKRGLRKNFSLVGQEPVLFDLSVRENILFGSDRDEVSQEEIEEAAKTANIHDFLMESPDKYETRVGDAGRQLSGGQKQRVAIARAIIRRPRVLLLDEATSALDSESEKHVQEALDKAVEKGGCTTISIAHRLSTIQNADVIFVFNDGKVVEQGSHFELLRLNGLYKQLVEDQNLNALK